MNNLERILLLIFVIVSAISGIRQELDIRDLKNNNSVLIQSTEVIADLGTPYNIKILNDHDVLLTTADDTIKLAFENAYSLSDEYVVYVME